MTAVELLREVIAYNEGDGKYKFDHLPSEQRQNEAFDAWQELRERIKAFLRSGK